MNIMLVFGRNISETAVRNIQTLKDLAQDNPEFAYLNEVLWLTFSFNSAETIEFRTKYFTNNHKFLPQTYIPSEYKSTIKNIHPAPNKLSKKAYNHFCSILMKMGDAAMVMATNENNRGRPYFALRAAKSYFIPYLNLSSKETEEKFCGLKKEMEKAANVNRDSLISYLEQFKLKHNMEFQLSENIKTMKRLDVLSCIDKVKSII